jgi:hypothetical protein
VLVGRARARSRAAALLVAALAAAGTAARAEEGLSPRKEALLLLRVLVYDRNLTARAGGKVRVAIVYRAGDRRSEARRDEVLEAFEDVAKEVVVAGLPVEVMAVAHRVDSEFAGSLRSAAPAYLYVCAGLEQAVEEIARTTRRQGVVSAAGSREMVEAGLAIGVVSRGKRAGVVVNLGAARSEGADFDAALLAIAEVIP